MDIIKTLHSNNVPLTVWCVRLQPAGYVFIPVSPSLFIGKWHIRVPHVTPSCRLWSSGDETFSDWHIVTVRLSFLLPISPGVIACYFEDIHKNLSLTFISQVHSIHTFFQRLSAQILLFLFRACSASSLYAPAGSLFPVRINTEQILTKPALSCSLCECVHC